MALRKETIGQQLARIQRLAPKRDDRTGFMYARADQKKRAYKKVTLYGLFVSDEGTFLLRPHVFKTDNARKPAEWAAWFSRHYTAEPQDDGRDGILANILSGMQLRTDKFWRLYRIVGFVGNDNSRATNPATRKRRGKASQTRGKNGRSNSRR